MEASIVRDTLETIISTIEAETATTTPRSIDESVNAKFASATRSKIETVHFDPTTRPGNNIATGAGARAVRVLSVAKTRGRSCFSKLDLSKPCDKALLPVTSPSRAKDAEDSLAWAFDGESHALGGGDEAFATGHEDDAFGTRRDPPSAELDPESEPEPGAEPVSKPRAQLEPEPDAWDDRMALEGLLQELLQRDVAKERAQSRLEQLEATRAKFRGALTKVRAAARLKGNQTRAQRLREEEEAQRREATREAQFSAARKRLALAAEKERSQLDLQAEKRLRKNLALVRAVACLKISLDSARGKSWEEPAAWTHETRVAYDPHGKLRLWDPARDPHGLQARLPRALKRRLRDRDLALKQRWLDNVNKT